MTVKTMRFKMNLMILQRKAIQQRLSKEFNVGRSTIKRDAAFAKGLNKLDTELRNEILTGKKKSRKEQFRH
jgi:ABC-type Zn uptake system ZnuABC Zn-binding protein ZnuA